MCRFFHRGNAGPPVLCKTNMQDFLCGIFLKCQSLSKWVVAKANILQLGCGKYYREPTAFPNKKPFHTKYVYSWGSQKQSPQWMPWEWPETWWGSGRRWISPAQTQRDCRSTLCQSCAWRWAQQWCPQNQPVKSNTKLKQSIVNKLFRLSDQPTSIKREEVPHLDLNYILLQSNKVCFIYFFTFVLFLLNKKHINRTI